MISVADGSSNSGQLTAFIDDQTYTFIQCSKDADYTSLVTEAVTLDSVTHVFVYWDPVKSAPILDPIVNSFVEHEVIAGDLVITQLALNYLSSSENSIRKEEQLFFCPVGGAIVETGYLFFVLQNNGNISC